MLKFFVKKLKKKILLKKNILKAESAFAAAKKNTLFINILKKNL